MITETTLRVQAKWNSVFQPVNRCRERYRILKGSAGSGKSVNVAQDYIKKLSSDAYRGANLLVVRKTDETNRDSTFAELRSAIHRLYGEYAEEIWKITLSPMSMEHRRSGNQIIFRGMKDDGQREKVKSITTKKGKLCWIWVEEATELTQEDVDILDDRLRGDLPEVNPRLYYQITMTFNPVSASHWIKYRYFDSPGAETFTHHSTYRDNRFIDPAYHRRMERRAVEDPEGYQVYGLGNWGELGGLILTNYEVCEFDTRREAFDSLSHGQDFGYNHANAILPLGFWDGQPYIRSEIYVHELDTTEIIRLADDAGLEKDILMYCDSAEPDRIKMWRTAGYAAVPAKKPPGSVKAQIDWLKGVKIRVHPSCVNTMREIGQWKWKKDPVSGLYLDQPVKFFDDAMAALRYGVEPYHNGNLFDILYYPRETGQKRAEIQNIYGVLMDCLELVKAMDGGFFCGTGMRGETVDGLGHFLISYNFIGRKPMPEEPLMEKLVFPGPTLKE